MAPQLTRIERERIIALRQSGCRIIDICRQTGITKKTVYFWLRRWEEDGSLEAHHRQLYQRATTAEQDEAIVAAHTADPFLSTRTSSSNYAALVAASLDDYRRPLDKVSTKQSATLAATGIIWTRYCLVIKPINYSLSLCNLLLGAANSFQCFRAYNYQRKMAVKA